MKIQKLLGQSAFWIVNKELARKVGIRGALLLSDLIDKQAYHHSKGELDDDGYFYYTYNDIEENTTIQEKQAKSIVDKMIELSIISRKRIGIPAKNFYKIDEDKVIKLVEQEQINRLDKNRQNGGTGTDKMAEHYNNNKNIIINNNILSKDNTTSDDVDEMDRDDNLEIFSKVRKVYKGKKTSFEKDTKQFLEKIKGYEDQIDYKLLFRNAESNSDNIYFQSWINAYLPKCIVSNSIEYGRSDINNLIQHTKKTMIEYNIPYNSQKERQFANFLLSKKYREDTNNYYNMSIYDYITTIIYTSTKLKYAKKINSLMTIYYNGVDILYQLQREGKALNKSTTIGGVEIL